MHYYAVNNWPGIAGDIDFDYISYIESKDSNLSDYFSVTNQLNSNPNQSNIDLFHMAATISALLYSSEWSDGNGIVDSIKHQFMFEYHLDNLAGWAGDFQQIVHDSAYKAKSEGVDFFDEIFSAMGSDDSRFSYSDWVTDADAVNIVNKINSSNNSLYEILKNYYNFGLNNRFTEFAKTFTRSDVVCYANYKFMSVEIWPIYDYSTDDEEYVEISLNQSGEATAAFMIYLEDLIVNETKN